MGLHLEFSEDHDCTLTDCPDSGLPHIFQYEMVNPVQLRALPDNKKCCARTLLATVEFMALIRPAASPLASGFGRLLRA